MAKIKKIVVKNYKRFSNYTIEPNDTVNILIGDNETGKSTILEIIDIVSTASVKKVENIGVSNIINYNSVLQFLNGERKIELLPFVEADLFLDGNFDWDMNGKNNLLKTSADGIRMIIAPNMDYAEEINEILASDIKHFPFEYYCIRFSTFADAGYSGYNKKIKSAMIDSSKMNENYATQEYVKNMYNYYTESNTKERVVHQSEFNQMRERFDNTVLIELNSRIPTDNSCSFALRKENVDFGNQLMIFEDGISICNKGSGKQICVKTEFALQKVGDNVDVLLIEEPENHLSYNNLRSLIQKVMDKYLTEDNDGQLFIATHSSYICMRLELKNALMLHKEDGRSPLKLKDLSDETSKFFIKTPPVGILDFILSKKSILVEGPAEYMLFERFYKNVKNKQMEMDNVQVFDARGLSFKRYLEIAKILNNKVAVITDNDGDYRSHISKKYEDYVECKNIKIFSHFDETKYTFEKTMYDENHELCKTLFGDDPLKYMINNKTESAYKLAISEEKISVPNYIKEAIEWISE